MLRRARQRGASSSVIGTLAVVGVGIGVGTAFASSIGSEMQSTGHGIGQCIQGDRVCEAKDIDVNPGRIADFRSESASGGQGSAATSGIGQFFRDAVEGAVKGDFVENPSLGHIAGQIAIGFTPAGVLGDLRDLGAAASDVWHGRQGGWGNVGLAAIAVIPGGDAIKALAKTRGAVNGVEAAATVARRVDDFNLGGKYETRSIRPTFVGEHLPGNKVWEGSQVKYLTAAERAPYKIEVRQVEVNGKMEGRLFGADGKPLNTTNPDHKDRAIYVMNDKGEIYVSTAQAVGEFHHSTLAGGNRVAAAGEIEVRDGKIERIDNSSGHYRPRMDDTMQAVDSLRTQGYGRPIDVEDHMTGGWILAK